MNVKLTEKEKVQIGGPDDLYDIMLRILSRDNRMDREKEHFWIIGLNLAGVILYIELVSLGSIRATQVEPLNVYRIAVLKGATRVVAVHNHPSGNITPSDQDKDLTDKLYQGGQILDIELEDHLIISTSDYLSFKVIGLMDELKQSIKYVPPYKLIERVKNEEKELREEMGKFYDQELEKKNKQVANIVKGLFEKQLSVEQIAEIVQLTPEEVVKIGKSKDQKP